MCYPNKIQTFNEVALKNMVTIFTEHTSFTTFIVLIVSLNFYTVTGSAAFVLAHVQQLFQRDRGEAAL